MIRTSAVELTTIQALAYRQKLKAGDAGIVILRPDVKQPGMATISRKTGEPVLAATTNKEQYPLEAFREAIALTNGMPFKKQSNIKVTAQTFAEPELPEEEDDFVEINVEALDRITEHYTDKNGRMSYDLVNKELIRFAKSSSIVRNMIDEGRSVNEIRDYIILNKFRNIAGNDGLSDKEVFKIAEVIDGIDGQGMFKQLNSELRKMLAKNKKN
ncbi:MAG: hypothetical protein IKX74_01805 [Erysipelotrichaceae bacterium]|nr:hypothetical protein [Erysipelotrichaceae bacterium]